MIDTALQRMKKQEEATGFPVHKPGNPIAGPVLTYSEASELDVNKIQIIDKASLLNHIKRIYEKHRRHVGYRPPR